MSDHPGLGDEFFDRIQKKLKSVEFDIAADPTRAWTLDSNAMLMLDLDSSALSGATMGDAFDRLSFLGPAEHFTPTIFNCVDIGGNQLAKPKPRYNISYASRGVIFLADERLRLESFHVYLQPDRRESGCGVFSGKVIWMGIDIGVSSLDRAETLLSILGTPERDEEEPEHDHPLRGLGKEPYRRSIRYRRPNAVWMIDFDEHGRTLGFGVLRNSEL